MNVSPSSSSLEPRVPSGAPVVEAASKGFQVLYSKGEYDKLPWHWPGLDPDFALGLERMKVRQGRAVDIGAGVGTQAVALAKLGFEMWATDFSSSAVQIGTELANEEKVSVRFVVDDICNTSLPHAFDFVFDRGCFHVIPPLQRSSYVDSILRLVVPGGFLFLKSFSSDEPPRPGPFRFTERELMEYFASGFELVESRATEFYGARALHPKAHFLILKRKG